MAARFLLREMDESVGAIRFALDKLIVLFAERTTGGQDVVERLNALLDEIKERFATLSVAFGNVCIYERIEPHEIGDVWKVGIVEGLQGVMPELEKLLSRTSLAELRPPGAPRSGVACSNQTEADQAVVTFFQNADITTQWVEKEDSTKYKILRIDRRGMFVAYVHVSTNPINYPQKVVFYGSDETTLVSLGSADGEAPSSHAVYRRLSQLACAAAAILRKDDPDYALSTLVYWILLHSKMFSKRCEHCGRYFMFDPVAGCFLPPVVVELRTKGLVHTTCDHRNSLKIQ
eukprot:Rmarinus@m.30134